MLELLAAHELDTGRGELVDDLVEVLDIPRRFRPSLPSSKATASWMSETAIEVRS